LPVSRAHWDTLSTEHDDLNATDGVTVSPPSEDAGRPLRLFVSYRRSDASAAARQLADAAKASFGEDNVFFDTQDLHLGTSWPDEIGARLEHADVVLAVIGTRWVDLADERGSRTVLNPAEEDVLRTELETALRTQGLLLVPVLVDDATMAPRDRLPRPFKPLASRQVSILRHASWTQDVTALMDALPGLVAAEKAKPTAQPRRPPGQPSPAATAELLGGRFAPDDPHFRKVMRYLDAGTVVPMLGAAVGASDGDEPWDKDSGHMPTADDLARALAAEFAIACEPPDLARVAQHIAHTEGAPELHRMLQLLLSGTKRDPAATHRFLAQLPGILRQRGTEQFQLIVSSGYDTLLERAFDEVHEPFDLAVFIARGEDEGSFLHVPWCDARGGEPKLMTPPNDYVGLPIDEDGVLARTVIVKIHGGVLHDAPAAYSLQHNFVITEDDYIGYLSRSPVESLIPLQILDKLRHSHLLFLEYGVRDWILRVFLRRIWADQKDGAVHWSIQRRLEEFDEALWEKLDVARFGLPVSAYVEQLERRLTA